MPSLAPRLLVVCALLSPVALAQDYGSGTPGAGGITPVLDSPAPYMDNAAFGFEIRDGIGGGTALFAFSLQRDAGNFLGLTEILVSADPFDLLAVSAVPLGGPAGVPGAGSAFVPFPLLFPPTYALAGLQGHAQAVIIDDLTLASPASTSGRTVELTMPPEIFVGTSTAGSSDPYWIVDPTAQAVSSSGGQNATNNVTGAAWGDGGGTLYVGSSITGNVSVADLSGPSPSWSTFWPSGTSSCYGVAYDAGSRTLYTLAGGSPSTRELVALNADPASPGYGTILGQTIGMTQGDSVERWTLSPDGRLAAVITIFSSPDKVILVDTDPNSPTWMQRIGAVNLPPASGGFNFPSEVRIDGKEEFALVLISGLTTEVARIDLQNQTAVDFNGLLPGTQMLGPQSDPPVAFGGVGVGLELAGDGSFAMVSGGGTNAPWWGRLDLFPGAPTVTAWNPFPVPSGLGWAHGGSLRLDDSEAAFASFGNGPPRLYLLDPQSGAVNGSVPLPGGTNIYTVLAR